MDFVCASPVIDSFVYWWFIFFKNINPLYSIKYQNVDPCYMNPLYTGLSIDFFVDYFFLKILTSL